MRPFTGKADPALSSSGTPGALPAIIATTVVLASLAPLVTSLSRSGAAPPEAYLIFERLFVFNDYHGSLAMLAMLAAALAVPRLQEAVVRIAVWAGEHPVPIVAASFVALALGARFVYMAHPLSMDEYAPWMQAHAFASGQLTAHYPPDLLDSIVPRAFQNVFIVINRATGEAVSDYGPGLALLQAPFTAVGAAWCVNPAFGALTLVLLHRLATEAAGDPAAGGWAMLAALASPQFTVGAMSFYAMPGELALNLLFLWLMLRGNLPGAFAAGVVGGLAFAMHNPAPHALMAVPCLAWLAADRKRWPRLLAVLVGYVPLWLLLVVGWSMLKNALRGGTGGAHAGLMRALADVLVIPTDTLLTAKWYAAWKVWIWACPGLLLVLFVPRERTVTERLLIAAFLVTWLFYFFVRFDQGHGWGYRYIHTAWGALPVVAGLWLAQGAEATRRWGGAMVAAGLLATPVFLFQTHATIEDALSYRWRPPGPGDWVVFVALDTGRYRGDLVQDPPGRSNPLYLVSRGDAKDRDLMAVRFPGAVEVGRDRRGSVWRLPEGSMPAFASDHGR